MRAKFGRFECILFAVVFIALALVLLSSTQGRAVELTGYVSAEGRVFLNPSIYKGQKDHNASLALSPELYHEWRSGAESVTFAPLLRLDSADPERTHFDVRELFYLRVLEGFEVGIGLRKVFWGVTESQHLVDIINQTDLVEGPDGEEKLGQPMVSLSMEGALGTLDLYLLPYFRERTFPGRRGRLRTEPYVYSGDPLYESSSKERHVDSAARDGVTLGGFDIGLSHFHGTSREPGFVPGTDNNGRSALIPYYEQIDQTGLELQFTGGPWLLKFEGIHRASEQENFSALTTGFEYTLYNALGTQADLGLLTEWLYDDRGESASTPMEDDIMAGLRLALNDVEGTEVLLGVVRDLSGSATLGFVESSRRITDHWKAVVEARIFGSIDSTDPLFTLRDDDLVKVELYYYF